MRDQFFDAEGATIEELAEYGTHLIEYQQSLYWWVGDLALGAERIATKDQDWHQAFPPCSPGLIDRCKAVAKAYPPEDRNPVATWSTHMRLANKPDRVALVAATVEQGLTSDEATKVVSQSPESRWLLVVDANFWLTKHYFSGADIETAVRVSEWIQRTVKRLQEKGLTDCAICFDSPNNFRKELTKGPEWEGQRYKDRPPKPDVLVQQLHLGRELLEKAGLLCVSIDGYEADDLIASFCASFEGRSTVLGIDKDLYQLLSSRTNMLTDVTWETDPSTADLLPEYHWFTEKPHPKLQCRNLLDETGLTPDQHRQMQVICGDSVDNVTGAKGVGVVGAKQLILEFGTLDAVIQAARDDDERIKPRKRESLLELAEKLDVVKQLVTLRTDLRVPMTTKLQT